MVIFNFSFSASFHSVTRQLEIAKAILCKLMLQLSLLPLAQNLNPVVHMHSDSLAG